MATIQVIDANGVTQTVQEPAAPGQSNAAGSKPVVLATDDPLVAVAGATSDAVVAAGAAGSLSAKLRAISRDLVANIVLAAGANVIGAVTQSGSWVLAAGSALVGKIKLSDGTTDATCGTYGTAPGAVGALNVNANVTNALSPGRATPANSAPVVPASQTYKTVAASQTAQVLGSTGATGDWLDFVLIIPASTSPGAVTLLDNATSITIFAGGASSVASLVPFAVPIRAVSASGAWKLTTGASVSAIGVGNFT